MQICWLFDCFLFFLWFLFSVFSHSSPRCRLVISHYSRSVESFLSRLSSLSRFRLLRLFFPCSRDYSFLTRISRYLVSAHFALSCSHTLISDIVIVIINININILLYRLLFSLLSLCFALFALFCYCFGSLSLLFIITDALVFRTPVGCS